MYTVSIVFGMLLANTQTVHAAAHSEQPTCESDVAVGAPERGMAMVQKRRVTSQVVSPLVVQDDDGQAPEGVQNAFPLTEEGFAAMQAQCCYLSFDLFSREVLTTLGLEICDEGCNSGFLPFNYCGKSKTLEDYKNNLLANTAELCACFKPVGQCAPGGLPQQCYEQFPTEINPTWHRRRTCKKSDASATITTTTGATTTTTTSARKKTKTTTITTAMISNTTTVTTSSLGTTTTSSLGTTSTTSTISCNSSLLPRATDLCDKAMQSNKELRDEWRTECVVEVCNAGEELAEVYAEKYDLDDDLDEPKSCSDDQQAYAKKACIENLNECGLATRAWVDSCVADICAAAKSGHPDPESLAEEACGPCTDFPASCAKFTTTTTTGTTLIVTAPPIACFPTSATGFDFTQSTVTVNNLGGTGSKPSEPQEVRYSRVATDIDLVVTNLTAFVPGSATATGKTAKFGRINQKTGMTTDFQFQFVETGTNTPKVIDEFYFSFYDIDEFLEGNNRETLAVGEYDSYMVESQTDLLVYASDDGMMNFQSQKPGWGCDNPKDPEKLGWVTCCDQIKALGDQSCEDAGYAVPMNQRNRSVMFIFKNKASFKVRLSVSGSPDKAGGRNFIFGGKSNLIDLCQDTLPTTTTTTINPNQEWPLCTGSELFRLPHPGSGAWHECVVPASLEQCEWYNKVKHKTSTPFRLGMGALGTQAPHGCFLYKDGADAFMGWNEQVGGSKNASFTHRLCCGEEFMRPTTTTTTVNWIPHDECKYSPCNRPPNTYEPTESAIPERPNNAIVGTCICYGDPHILPFDADKTTSKHFNHYGTGIYWIVKSKSVWIQGYYASANRHRPSNTYLRKVAIGGPFLGANTIMVEASNVWLNADPDILDLSAPGEKTWTGINGSVTATSNATSQQATVSLKFPQTVNINIVTKMARKSSHMLPYMSMLVKMRQISDQDGHCGNFNKVASDDLGRQIQQRGGDTQVDDSEALIPY